jgi:hypothetical protein
MSSMLLDQLLDPLAQSFSEQQARQILEWRLDGEACDRLARLREGANEGTLSEEDAIEYRRWVDDLDVIALIQAKARQALTRNAA